MAPSISVSVYPWIEASGVRNSWETLITKSLRTRSSFSNSACSCRNCASACSRFPAVSLSVCASCPNSLESVSGSRDRKLPWASWPACDMMVAKRREMYRATTAAYTVDAATYYYYTESNSRRQGLEFQLNGSLGALVNYGLTWTHLLVNETETSGVTTDNITVAYPENTYTARIGAAWNGWRANISGKNVDPWFTSTSSMGTATNVKLGDYIRYDANIAKDLSFAGHWATAEIYGRNLTNDRYSTRY